MTPPDRPRGADTGDGLGETTVVHLLRHGEVFNPTGVLYGRLPGFHLSEAGHGMARTAAAWFAEPARLPAVTHVVASPLQRAQETAAPIAAGLGLDIATDERLIEAGNQFEGQAFGVGDGALKHPSNWWRLRNPWTPSWGEPYAEIAARMLGAVHAARDAARGSAAVCVSHQLPIWTLRLHVEGRRYLHDPRKRQCGLASVTSLTYVGEHLAAVGYAEPAGPAGKGQVGGA
ncbi:histidine phosphatase family protein [Modestobacter sp. I12A-02628]|uniref:Histidine phosphatase family protein n=1 Tax=Goekera deserti TaxID=2497753 RepID=A0A7K3W8P7_9ACTN|nr:histidine phosphatase family protein [Goekera deserti]MPR00501.1 histidine phosphatase family protein [Goekera deserti]NDI49100.1 histidine phosphatase family protein [Goekera deserti]NEL52838.1 histidine phosphatase family protein [Goekera deserti]